MSGEKVQSGLTCPLVKSRLGPSVGRDDPWPLGNAFPECELSNCRQTGSALSFRLRPVGSDALAFATDIVAFCWQMIGRIALHGLFPPLKEVRRVIQHFECQ